MEIEFTDRYKATGTPYPTKDSCDERDGMGVYPQRVSSLNEEACKYPSGLLVIGQKEKDGTPCEEDGYVFVRCPVCDGSRDKPTKEE